MNSDDINSLSQVAFMGKFLNLLDNEVIQMQWETSKTTPNNRSPVTSFEYIQPEFCNELI